ncbi:hypothetical protein MRX96_039355 [Rhipicephalus microplus]
MKTSRGDAGMPDTGAGQGPAVTRGTAETTIKHTGHFGQSLGGARARSPSSDANDDDERGRDAAAPLLLQSTPSTRFVFFKNLFCVLGPV